LFLWLLVSLQGFAQFTKVYGTIIDAQSKEPLPFVNLIFKGSNTGSSSTISGSYSLQSTQSYDSIIISTVGYKKQTLFIQRNQTQRINIELERTDYSLKEVVVKKGKNP